MEAFWPSLEMLFPAKKAAPPFETCKTKGAFAVLAASRAATTVDEEVTLMAGRAKPDLRANWKSYCGGGASLVTVRGGPLSFASSFTLTLRTSSPYRTPGLRPSCSMRPVIVGWLWYKRIDYEEGVEMLSKELAGSAQV